jgi:hypothetical protein
MTCCYNESEIKIAVTKALSASKRSTFLMWRCWSLLYLSRWYL